MCVNFISDILTIDLSSIDKRVKNAENPLIIISIDNPPPKNEYTSISTANVRATATKSLRLFPLIFHSILHNLHIVSISVYTSAIFLITVGGFFHRRKKTAFIFN